MLIALLSLVSYAQDCDLSRDVLLIGVEHSPPSSILHATSDGPKWEGVSVDLWEHVADKRGWKYEYVSGEFQQMLRDVSDCKLDVVLPGITITPEREAHMDFSHTYLVENVAVATNINKNGLEFAGEVLYKLIYPATYLATILLFVGSFYCLFEKGRKNLLRNLLDSTYWALTTVTTVGYGDEAPKKVIGRLFSMAWMFAGVFIMAGITAQMLSAFNDSSWEPDMDDLSDLKNEKVLTVAGSFSDELLIQNQIPHQTVKTQDEMFESFRKSEVDFIIYDRSILEYHLGNNHILDVSFYDQHLGFAVRPNLHLLEEINIGILSGINTNWWVTTLFQYTHEGK